MKIKMNMPRFNTEKIPITGLITVNKEVTGAIDFVIESNKCNFNLTSCTRTNAFNFAGMCDMFKEKNAFYSPIFDSIEPSLRCPIKPGNYTLRESILDLSPVRYFPMDGFVHVTTFRLVSGAKGNKPKKIVLCLNTEVKIFKTRKVLQN